MILLSCAIMLLIVCMAFVIYHLNQICNLIKLNDKELYQYLYQRESSYNDEIKALAHTLTNFHHIQISFIKENFEEHMKRLEGVERMNPAPKKRRPFSDTRRKDASEKAKQMWEERRRREAAKSLPEKIAAIQQLPEEVVALQYLSDRRP